MKISTKLVIIGTIILTIACYFFQQTEFGEKVFEHTQTGILNAPIYGE